MIGMKNSRKQGDVGLAMAISYFAANGITVSLPLTDSQAYDLIVDINNSLKRVQAKTTTFKRNRNWIVELRTKGGNRSGVGKIRFLNTNVVDLLFVACADGAHYLIPASVVVGMGSITLARKYDQFRVDGRAAEGGRL